jgi:hypothetical protein
MASMRVCLQTRLGSFDVELDHDYGKEKLCQRYRRVLDDLQSGYESLEQPSKSVLFSTNKFSPNPFRLRNTSSKFFRRPSAHPLSAKSKHPEVQEPMHIRRTSVVSFFPTSAKDAETTARSPTKS